MTVTDKLSTTNPQTSPVANVLLGSSSPFRANLLKKLHLEFEQSAPDIDETPLPNESAKQMVERLTKTKAFALQKAFPEHIIIASDQAACFNDIPLGKPHTFEQAKAQLQNFSGNKVIFYTGLGVINPSTGEYFSAMDVTTVHFRELEESTIENYLEIEQPLDCAGSFKSEGLGITLFEKLESTDPNALIGLPLIELTSIFRKLDIKLPIKQSPFRPSKQT